MISDLNPAMMAPIGILDSGLGGLTVLREIRVRFPGRPVLYLADTANVPYGDKTLERVRNLALALTDHLVERGCTAVMMASGTSTAAGLEAAQRQHPDTTIVGTILPGARAALNVTRGGRIGVMSTAATARSLAFTHAIQALNPTVRVIEVGCPRFVPLVESGRAGTLEAFDAAREYLDPLIDAEVDTVILGCTHFPFLLNALHDACGVDRRTQEQKLIFVDPAAEAAAELQAKLLGSDPLQASALAADDGSISRGVEFAATGNPQEFARQASFLLGETILSVRSLTLPV